MWIALWFSTHWATTHQHGSHMRVCPMSTLVTLMRQWDPGPKNNIQLGGRVLRFLISSTTDDWGLIHGPANHFIITRQSDEIDFFQRFIFFKCHVKETDQMINILHERGIWAHILLSEYQFISLKTVFGGFTAISEFFNRRLCEAAAHSAPWWSEN